MKITPSLNISVTDKCNMNCEYCPPFGENLFVCHNRYSSQVLENIITACYEKGLRILRLTGGEPTLEPGILFDCLAFAKKKGYTSVILSTNGLLLEKYLDKLQPYKQILRIKISLDTLRRKRFKKITRIDGLKTVISTLECFAKAKFNIGINTVVIQRNKGELLKLIKYAAKKNIDIKLLGLNSFGGKISVEKRIELFALEKQINSKYKYISDEKLPGNRGDIMKTYCINENGNILFIMEHTKQREKWEKTFARSCFSCRYYPCSSGLLHLFLRADGVLLPCRLRPDLGYDINNSSFEVTKKCVEEILENYFGHRQ